MPVAAGAARRRRERRLRSWLQHDQLSVRAAAVSALHHSRDAGPAQHHVDACTQTETLVEHAAPAPAAHATPPNSG